MQNLKLLRWGNYNRGMDLMQFMLPQKRLFFLAKTAKLPCEHPISPQ